MTTATETKPDHVERQVQPILAAIDVLASQWEECPASWSGISHTACSRMSGEDEFVVWLVMAPTSLDVGACGKTGAVHSDRPTTIVSATISRLRSFRQDEKPQTSGDHHDADQVEPFKPLSQQQDRESCREDR